MTTLLHLSDLHLGKKDPWERKTDDKVGIGSRDENSRLDVLRTSLKAIRRSLVEGSGIDAVVVTGDLTTQNDPEGFRRFKSLLLDEVPLVEPARMLVVPGNHDVDWDQQPGSSGKYQQFLQTTRDVGMRTPFCDGVDVSTNGSSPLIELDDAVVVGINSANWCGTQTSRLIRTRVLKRRKTVPGPLYDIARVSEKQLDFLTGLIQGLERDDRRVRIAVLHHHLLPVTEDEEVKAFESFTNLARLRGWLLHHGFHVVLHGHKHASAVTWDHIADLGDADRTRRLLTLSSPRPSTWGEPVARVLRLGRSRGRVLVGGAPALSLDTFQAERAERVLAPEQLEIELDGGLSQTGVVHIECRTADAAYERLVSELRDRPENPVLNVVCVVHDPTSAEQIPSNYAQALEEQGLELQDPQGWTDDAVKWWQLAAPALVSSGTAPYNHGERLRRKRPGGRSPLEQAAALLGSTKATLLLVREGELFGSDGAPAFVVLQLVLASDASGERLDCVGYFRKQDLSLWWPVNVAELRRVQMDVLDLRGDHDIRAGRLVTISVEGTRDDVLPQLAGTRVDRDVDLRPERLMRLAYAAAHGPANKLESIESDWSDELSDIGVAAKDFPSLGIERLIEHLNVFAKAGRKTNVEPLISALKAVSDRAYRARAEVAAESERARRAEELFKLVGNALDALRESVERSDRGEGSSSD